MGTKIKFYCIVEDRGHKDFITEFLKCHFGWPQNTFTRKVAFNDFSKMGGAGTKKVHDTLKEKYPHKENVILLVMLDADNRNESSIDEALSE